MINGKQGGTLLMIVLSTFILLVTSTFLSSVLIKNNSIYKSKAGESDLVDWDTIAKDCKDAPCICSRIGSSACTAIGQTEAATGRKCIANKWDTTWGCWLKISHPIATIVPTVEEKVNGLEKQTPIIKGDIDNTFYFGFSFKNDLQTDCSISSANDYYLINDFYANYKDNITLLGLPNFDNAGYFIKFKVNDQDTYDKIKKIKEVKITLKKKTDVYGHDPNIAKSITIPDVKFEFNPDGETEQFTEAVVCDR